MCRLIIIFVFIPYTFIIQNCFAQTDSSSQHGKLIPMLETGVSTGGEVTDGLFLYRNAVLAEMSLNLKQGSKSYFGIGSGIEYFTKDHFIPLFLQYKGMAKNKNSSSFISIQAGYTFHGSIKRYSIMDVETKGGLFFSPGIGYKLKLEKYLVLLSINYKHQFIRLRYTGIPGSVYEHDANLHMLSFKAGITLD